MSINLHCGGDENTARTSISPDDVSQEGLSRGLSLHVKSRGHSMDPFIKDGDSLLIEPLNAAELHPGDIALFYLQSGSFVVHRFIKRNGSGLLLTNGDNMRYLDEPVAEEQVFGRVVQIEHNGKALSLTGGFYKLNSKVITLLARHRVPLQITLKKILGRMQWLIGQRRVK